MKIEKYELTKKNIYNVYLSNGEVLELNGKVITDNELLIKKDIDNELYDKLKRDNTICMLMDTSVKYIDRRLRSINELRDYLKNKEEDTIIIEEVIDKLIDYKYLDDDRFTKAFIKDKLNFTNWGDYKIKNELKRLGVNEEIIYNNISNIDDNIYYERINKIIDKDISINKKYSGIKLKNKIYNHLLTLGYSKEKVISIINNYNF
ncbi:regulatory protein RecX [Firmicutes bacterium CAG:321]|jgi:regulatory protein|nr:regulatory protein RecX [Firmicutes bacterium CAG:321]